MCLGFAAAVCSLKRCEVGPRERLAAERLAGAFKYRVLTGTSPTPQVDVFSFGICLWEIWQRGEQPYANTSLADIFAGAWVRPLRGPPF